MPRTHGRPGGAEAAFPALAAWIRARMGTRSLGQVERDSGVSKSSLSEYRRGTSFPTLESIGRLASYFAVGAAEIEALRGTGGSVADAGWTDAFAEKVAARVVRELLAVWPPHAVERRPRARPPSEETDPAAG